MSKTQNAKEQAQDFHDFNRQGKAELRTDIIPEHMAKDAEMFGGKKLLQKRRDGTLTQEAFKAALEILKDPNKKSKDEYKVLIKRLEEGRFLHRGEHFERIVDAYESDNEEVSAATKAFIKQADRTQNIQGENDFLRKIKKIQKDNEKPEDVIKQMTTQLKIGGIGQKTTKDEAAEIVDEIPDLGVMDPPPESVREKAPTLVRGLTEDLEEETAKLKEMDALLKDSKILTQSKAALTQKLNEVPEMLERMVKDYELFKRIAEIDNNPEILEALKDTQKAQNAFYKGRPGLLEKDETPYTKFLKSQEGAASREALMASARKHIPVLAEHALEIEVQREIDGEIFESADRGDEEVSEEKLKQVADKIKTKYEFASPILEDDILKKLKEKTDAVLKHEKEKAPSRSEYLGMAIEARNWSENACLDREQYITEGVEPVSGIRVLEEKNGLRIYPEEVEIEYDDYPTKPMGERSETTGLDGIMKDKNGKAVQIRKKGTITVDYEDQEYEYPDEEIPKWHAPIKPRGRLKIHATKADGKKEKMGVSEFLGWTQFNNVCGTIKSVEELERQIFELTGIQTQIRKGAMFHNKMDPQHPVVEIEEVENGGVRLKDEVTYRAAKEGFDANSVYTDKTRKNLSFGEFLSFITRKSLTPLNQPSVSLEELTDNPETYRIKYSPRDPKGELVEMYRDGTFGEDYVNKVLAAGAVMTAAQRQVLANHPTFAIKTKDGFGNPVVREKQSAPLLMGMQNKYDLQQAMEGADLSGLGTEQSPGDLETMSDAQREAIRKKEEALKEKEEKEKDPDEKKDKYSTDEALPSNETGTQGEAMLTSVNFMKKLWSETRVLATDDIWGMMKAAYEHYERRWHRRSKEKFGTVGKGLPWGYGIEMDRIKQAAENEEVNQNVEAMEEWGVWQIQDALRHAKNKDQFKACFKILAKKGHLRWDDVHMWRKLNQYIPESLIIPIPPGDDPYFVDRRTNKSGYDYLEGAIDFLWGESTFQDWHSENNSAYSQKLKQYWEKGKQLEGDPKHTDSIEGELAMLLTKHKKGEYVDPHEYEGLIHFIIDAGKGNMQAKVYYILEGVSAKNPKNGETLMSFDRIGSINGDYLNRLPFMDYLVRRDVPRPDGTESSWTLADISKWCNDWDTQSTSKPGYPPQGVTDFIWKYILTDERTIIRNNKGLRKAEEMDHDDAHFIIPLADEDLVTNICQSASGSKRYFTTEGYNNAYPGYNQYAKTLAELGEKAKLLSTIRGFARFNSIMDGRYKKEQDNYARLGSSFWNRPSVVDDRFTGWHKTQMEKLIEAIAQEYGDQELIDIVVKMHEHVDSVADPVQAKKQKEIQVALDTFGKKFEKVAKTDGGRKMMNVVKSFGLTGMPKQISPEERAMRKKMYGEKDELTETFTDWQADKNF